MISSLVRLLAVAVLCAAGLPRPAFGQTENRDSAEAIADEPTRLSLDDAAVQSRIALYSDTTKGQCHEEEARQFQAVAERFIAAVSAREAQQVPSLCSLPFFLEDERLLDQESLTARLQEILFPGVFALEENKRVLILDTLKQLEQLLEKPVPAAVRKMWAEHVTRSSRIAIVSGGPMLVGLSLRKSDGQYTVSGLLFAYFPKPDDAIVKAVNEGLLHQ